MDEAQRWLLEGWKNTPWVLASVAAVYTAIVVCTRLGGLRSFSKMSAFDFAMTVAVGSLFASAVVSPSPSVVIAVVALAGLYGGQTLIAKCRAASPWFSTALDNQPVLLYARGEFVRENMRKTRVTERDIASKVRGAGLCSLEQVHAVVFETTGDVSVVSSADGVDLDPFVLQGVKGVKHATAGSPPGASPASPTATRA